MGTRGVRLVIVVLLLAASAIAAQMLRESERRAETLSMQEADVAARLARLGAALNGIGAAQSSYFVPAQADNPWLQRMPGLVRQFYEDLAALGPLLQSPRSASDLQSLSDSSAALIAADNKARENLRLGEQLMAADLVLSGQAALEGMLATLSALQEAESAIYRAQRDEANVRRWSVVGVVGGAWALATLLLALVPTRRNQLDTSPETGTTSIAPRTGPVASPEVDLGAVAELCGAISRATSTAAFPALLSRVAAMLHASGVILWIAAGEELFAVTAHGYKSQVVAQLGPIPRGAQNATALAWREGRVTSVAEDAQASAAIVAPIFASNACLGVLSVELQPRRKADPSLQSLASLIAAQLASAAASWPTADPAAAAAR